MTGFHFRPARRSEAKPLIGIHSESGCGKTYSALLLARGFVGKTGRIGMIETESGRGEAYADPAEYPELAGEGQANYDVLPLRNDFSPANYGRAIDAAEQAELDALIIDSASHEWEGAGGVLSLAADNQAAGKKGVLVWQQPKLEHQRHFMLRFMQTPIPLVILCMRSKYPMKEVKKQGGGKEWLRSETLEPKQADDILFEMFVHGWIDQAHRFHMAKCTAKDLEPVFGQEAPISLETGQRLADWARSRSVPPLDLAKAAARKGIEAFRLWWSGEGRQHREAVRDHLSDLQKIAADADKANEDPFAAPETPAESDPAAPPQGSGQSEDGPERKAEPHDGAESNGSGETPAAPDLDAAYKGIIARLGQAASKRAVDHVEQSAAAHIAQMTDEQRQNIEDFKEARLKAIATGDPQRGLGV